MTIKKVVSIVIVVSMLLCMIFTSVSTSAAESNETIIYNFLINEMGLNKAAACGVLANIEVESGFNPTLTGDSGTSYGICQWHNQRFTALKTFCNEKGYDYRTLIGQLYYLQYDLTNNFSGVLSYLKSVDNTEQGAYNAASYWCYYFEKPANTAAQAENRGNVAKQTYWLKYGISYYTMAETDTFIYNVSSSTYISYNKSNNNNVELSSTKTKLHLSKASTGYIIKPVDASGVLNIYANTVTSGKNVTVYEATGDSSQEWLFERTTAPDGKAAYIIRSAASPTCVLDISGTNIYVNTYSSSSKTQYWRLSPIETYVVKYNLNGGTPTITNQSKSYGVNLKITTTVPTKSGYIFLNWLGSDGKTYAPGEYYTGNAALTLSAQWIDSSTKTYTVKYDLNGGTPSIPTQTKIDGIKITLSDITPTKSGFNFVFWQNSDGTVYYPKSNYDLNSDLTLKAVWAPIEQDDPVAEGLYLIRNVSTGDYLGLKDNSVEKGTDVLTKSSSTTFVVTYRGSGYTIRPFKSDSQVVNVWTSSAVKAGDSIRLYNETGDASQQWTFKKAEQYYAILSAENSALALEANTTAIILKSYSTVNKAQLWELVPVALYDNIKDGLHKIDGEWFYINNRIVDTSFTGLAKNDYGWFFVKNGIYDKTYTGLAKNDYGTWYVVNGTIANKSTSGMFKTVASDVVYPSTWVYITNGKFDNCYTGLAKNSYGWFYMKNGKLDKTFTGLAKNDYGWFFVRKGSLDSTYTGLGKNEYGIWYVVNGTITSKTTTGMFKTSTSDSVYPDKWIYIENGRFAENYTGMAKNSYGWFYITKGILDRSFTGIATNPYGSWYMKNGALQKNYTGTLSLNGKTYTIKNGQVK